MGLPLMAGREACPADMDGSPMSERPRVLQTFVVAARTAFRLAASDQESRNAVDRIFTAAERAGVVLDQEGSRLPVCDSLDAAMSIEPAGTELKDLVEAFRAVEPQLAWRKRMDTTGTGSASFADSTPCRLAGPAGWDTFTRPAVASPRPACRRRAAGFRTDVAGSSCPRHWRATIAVLSKERGRPCEEATG